MEGQLSHFNSLGSKNEHHKNFKDINNIFSLIGLSLGIFLFTLKAYSLYKSLYAVKSLVAQLAPSRVFNGDILTSNLLSPSCNYRIINKKEKKINVLCIHTQSKINEIHHKIHIFTWYQSMQS